MLSHEIVRAAALGAIKSGEEFTALLGVATGTQKLLRPAQTTDEARLGIKHIDAVLDANGDLLLAGQNYLDRGKVIRVLRAEFGGGNMLDTFYRVWYLGQDLREHFILVEVAYPRGIEGGPQYQSELTPEKAPA